MSNFIQLPKGNVSPQIRDEVENALPKPESYPGWKFNKYRWIKLTQINTKDKNGNTDNSVRVSGTGDNESLQNSLSKGIDVTKLTPSVYPNNNLMNGFNRHKNLLELGYKEWIFAEYELDESTRTEFQQTFEDCLDDFRASANKGDGQKVISDAEVEEIGRKRFEHRKDRTKQKIADWIRTLDLNWSSQKIEAISKRISLDFQRKGVIESFNRNEAQQFLNDAGIGADLLNTTGSFGDNTRVLRLYVQIMENFIANQDTFNVALFDSQASSHDDIDARREDTIKLMKELDKIVIKYAAARMLANDVEPWEIIGAIPQKIGVENMKSSKLVSV
jgi:hypothetical protein